MEALLLAVPHWLTELVFKVSVVVLIVAFCAVLVRALCEYRTPIIEDDEDDDDIPEITPLQGGMTQAEFERAYGVQR